MPSSWNCTPATPTLSLAVAEIVTAVPETVALLEGAVIATAGAVTSALLMVMLMVAAVLLPAVSRATAFSVCAPLVASVLSNVDRVGGRGVLRAERGSVEQELHAGDADVVGGRRADTHRGPRHRRAVGG